MQLAQGILSRFVWGQHLNMGKGGLWSLQASCHRALMRKWILFIGCKHVKLKFTFTLKKKKRCISPILNYLHLDVAQQERTLLPMQEMWVQSLGREDALEKEMQPIPQFLPGKSHGQRCLAGYSLWGCRRVRDDLATKQQYYSIVHMYHIFFIHPSADGCLGRFHMLADVNGAAVSIGVHASFCITVFSGYVPSTGIAGSCGNPIFSFF